MRPDQLPDVVAILAAQTGQQPGAILFGLHVTGAQIMQTPAGAAMFIEAGRCLAAVAVASRAARRRARARAH